MIEDLSALIQVVLADIVLAGDNAVAVGLAAAALSPVLRKRAIMIGIALALLFRIGFALVAVQLLAVKGILLAGGLLLLWVAWRMWKDIEGHESMEKGFEIAAAREAAGADLVRVNDAEGSQATAQESLPDGAAAAGPEFAEAHSATLNATVAPAAAAPSFNRALLSIILADVSMSLDNVLVVAAVARHSPEIMAFGLVLSVVLMGVAASMIAGVINKYRWIAYVGLVVIVFAAIRMIWEDGHALAPSFIPSMPSWLGGGAHAAPS